LLKYTTNVVRIGGSSKDEEINEFNLIKIQKREGSKTNYPKGLMWNYYDKVENFNEELN